MPKPLAVQIKFMFDRSNLSSQRDYELQNSEARSHIAKIVHIRKQKTSPPQKKARPIPDRKHSSETETDSSESSTEITVAQSTYAPSLLSTHYLDPLFNVPHPKERSFYKAMDIWFQWILPSAAPAFIIFNVGNMFASVSCTTASESEYRGFENFDLGMQQYFSSPGCQSEAAQHCIAALAYGCLEQHRQETMSWEYDYRQEQMRHNGAALALLKKDIASNNLTGNSPTTINTIFLLSFLAVRNMTTSKDSRDV
ncbi:hypothetical protein LTR84_012561 [Exophiala bonariae]|uniref:Transcription factor domain-containing protein n=1 Tax=Exophiala bonariae TaxID=1690606 RepID=A0AAV9NEQ4_9EURO|nr:hypothetical protein LTR84_012561 [Exophiala bonariae]